MHLVRIPDQARERLAGLSQHVTIRDFESMPVPLSQDSAIYPEGMTCIALKATGYTGDDFCFDRGLGRRPGAANTLDTGKRIIPFLDAVATLALELLGTFSVQAR
jgi:hypothetical protein